MTSFPYNGEHWQNWKFLYCQHTSPDEMGTERQAPNTNMVQNTYPDEMESEQQVPNMNVGQKTSLFHSDGEHSIDVLTVLSLLKTNQLHQRIMMFQSVYLVNDNLIKGRKERMKDMTLLYLSTLISLISTLTREEVTLIQYLERATRESTMMCL